MSSNSVNETEWIDSYPKGKPDITELPSPWVEALDIAISQSKIPDIPPSYLEGGSLKYPGDLDPMSSLVCSTAAKCSMNPEVWWDVPDGVWALSFDDGPLPVRWIIIL